MSLACTDCGVCPSTTDHVVMLVQSVVIAGKTVSWRICSRCYLRRGVQDQREMQEQAARTMKAQRKEQRATP